jgi:hypothetical protein
MGAVFALAPVAIDIATARPKAVGTGMRITFAVAAFLIALSRAHGRSRKGVTKGLRNGTLRGSDAPVT